MPKETPIHSQPDQLHLPSYPPPHFVVSESWPLAQRPDQSCPIHSSSANQPFSFWASTFDDVTASCRLVVVVHVEARRRIAQTPDVAPSCCCEGHLASFPHLFLAGWDFWYHWYQNVDGFFLRFWPILLANSSLFETSKEFINAPFSKDSKRKKAKAVR